MKRKLIFLFSFLPLFSLYSQVGINNETPKATLHITPTKTDASTAEGIIAPNLSRAQLITKDTQYTVSQKGAMVLCHYYRWHSRHQNKQDYHTRLLLLRWFLFGSPSAMSNRNSS